MRRLVLIGIAMAGVMAGLGLARYIVGRRAPQVIERMMENVMPQMMDACFGQMSQQRREFMLGHCRGLLEQMDEKYAVTRCAVRPAEPTMTQPTQPTEPATPGAPHVGVA